LLPARSRHRPLAQLLDPAGQRIGRQRDDVNQQARPDHQLHDCRVARVRGQSADRD
jgi:hypothetical protein